MKKRVIWLNTLIIAVGVVAFWPWTVASARPLQPQRLLTLPDGYTVEGMTINQRTATFYADSHVTGDIYAGNMYTGKGGLLVHDTTQGEQAYGVALDTLGRLWVAYGTTGQVRVFDPRTGARLATYQLAKSDGSSLLNDLLVTKSAVYVTDSFAQQMYVIPSPCAVKLPPVNAGRTIPLVGNITYSSTGKYNLPFNGNGIETTPDGHRLLIDQTNAGKLFEVNPVSGLVREVKITNGDLPFADGLRRLGTTLYVAENDSSQVAELKISPDASSATIVAHPLGTRPYARPAALAVFDGRMYVSQMFSLDPYSTPDWIDSFAL